MFFRYKSSPWHIDPMTNGDPTTEALLKPSLFLRYDRAHAGAAARDDEQRSAEVPTAAGEADMDVTGPGSVGDENPVRPTESLPSELVPTEEATSAVPGSETPSDEVEVSETADVIERLGDDPDLRAERLARIQAAVAAGTYETTEKLEMAVDRLLRDIG